MGYGWSTKQLARINARRAARGQKPLAASIRSEKDAEDYDTEYSKQYARRRRKGVEEEDDETQVVDKEDEDGEKLGTAAAPRLEEYKKRLRQRQIEKARGFAPSPFGFQAGSLA
jgi:hypothetical protein